ncbi:MAG: NUDIX domain-containing protein [Acidimicrobiales bacterium]
MPRLSAGILLYRHNDAARIEVLIAHPGGPFFVKKDDAAWSIPKGEYDAGEDPLAAAEREFEEELGAPPPLGARVDLGELAQSRAKRVHAWAIEGDFDATKIASNTFKLEWPPKSGENVDFPEVDRAAWFEIPDATRKLVSGQVEFLDRLIEVLGQ